MRSGRARDKVFIVYDNDDYYVQSEIGVFSSEEKAQKAKEKIQPYVTQEITIDKHTLDEILPHYQKKVKK